VPGAVVAWNWGLVGGGQLAGRCCVPVHR
jgi:hypothetical protein